MSDKESLDLVRTEMCLRFRDMMLGRKISPLPAALVAFQRGHDSSCRLNLQQPVTVSIRRMK